MKNKSNEQDEEAEVKEKEQIEEAGVLHRRIIVQLVDYLANNYFHASSTIKEFFQRDSVHSDFELKYIDKKKGAGQTKSKCILVILAVYREASLH